MFSVQLLFWNSWVSIHFVQVVRRFWILIFSMKSIKSSIMFFVQNCSIEICSETSLTMWQSGLPSFFSYFKNNKFINLYRVFFLFSKFFSICYSFSSLLTFDIIRVRSCGWVDFMLDVLQHIPQCGQGNYEWIFNWPWAWICKLYLIRRSRTCERFESNRSFPKEKEKEKEEKI